MHEPIAQGIRLVELAPLGERLAPLRLCDAHALRAMRRSLERHGQLGALTLFVAGDVLEIVDGFKRVRAARALSVSRSAHFDGVFSTKFDVFIRRLSRRTRR